MYWKQSDSEEIERIEALHGGEGTVLARPFLRGREPLPVRVYVWELPAGVAWGGAFPPGRRAAGRNPVLPVRAGYGDGERRDIQLGPGEALLLAQGSVHSFRNDGPAPLKLLLVLGRPGGR